MSFDPVCGPGSPSYVYFRSLVFTYFTSLAALCSSLLTKVVLSVDNLAVRVHPSCCPICQYNRLRHHYLNKGNREEERKTALVFDRSTKNYTLERHDNIDSESPVQFIQPLFQLSYSLRTQSRKVYATACLPTQHSLSKSQLPKEPNPSPKSVSTRVHQSTASTSWEPGPGLKRQ